jgi:VWFA-related protein
MTSIFRGMNPVAEQGGAGLAGPGPVRASHAWRRPARPGAAHLALMLFASAIIASAQPASQLPPAGQQNEPAPTDPGQTDPGQTDPGQTNPGQTNPGQTNPALRNRPPTAPSRPGATTAPGSMRLDFTVHDAAGKPVPGLEPGEVQLLDDGKRQRMLSYRSFDGVAAKPDPPVEIILVVDTANLPFEQVAFTRKEIGRLLHENGGQLAHPVSMMLLTDAGLRVQPRASTDGNALSSVLNQIKGGIRIINSATGVEGEVERFQLSLRAMSDIAENEAKRPGRKLLIWVGPGWPMLDSRSFNYSEKQQRRYFDEIVELTNRIRQARMTLYSVSAPEPQLGASPDRRFLYQDFLKGVATARQADTGNLALKVLVTHSGGRILGPDNELAKQIDDCIADADAFYTISFNPPAAEHANAYHELKVEISPTGGLASAFTVRTTTGYYDEP